jgi:hypothetical protein
MEKWVAVGFLVVLLISAIITKRRTIIFHLRNLFKKTKSTKNPNSDYNFDLIGRYYHNSIEEKKYYPTINDSIANDLDIDDAFRLIDRTSSKIGQQFLYAEIRTIDSVEKPEQFDRFTEQFQKEKELSEFIRLHLEKLSDNNGYLLERLIHEPLISYPHIKFVRLLTFSFVVILGLGIFYPILLLFLLPIFIVNLVLYYSNKSNITYYSSAVQKLSKTLPIAKKLSKNTAINEQFPDLLFIENIEKIRKKLWVVNSERLESNDLMLPLVIASDLIKIASNIEPLSFSNLINQLETKKDDIDKLFCFIGEIDSALSVFILRTENFPTCKPVFTSQKEINIENIIHPLIDDCVPNSLAPDNKNLLLTGSNMSGETTFIRTISINSILAQTIYTVFAERYTAPFLKIFSSIRISDDIRQKTNYFLKEVLTIKDFITAFHSEKQCLFVLDEIFKGTKYYRKNFCR